MAAVAKLDMNVVRAFFEGLLSVWAKQDSVNVPAEFENARGAGSTGKRSANVWVRGVLRPGNTDRISIDDGLKRETGLFLVSFFSKRGLGTARVRTLASALALYISENSRIAVLPFAGRVDPATFTVLGETGNDLWQADLSFPYNYDFTG